MPTEKNGGEETAPCATPRSTRIVSPEALPTRTVCRNPWYICRYSALMLSGTPTASTTMIVRHNSCKTTHQTK